MSAGIVVGTTFVQNKLGLFSKASNDLINLDGTTVECKNNLAVVRLKMNIPNNPDSYSVTRSSPTQDLRKVVSYSKSGLSQDYEVEPGIFSYDDTEVYTGTEYTYVLSVNGVEESATTVRTTDCTAEQTSCNGNFCLMLREKGCNKDIPYYLFEWTVTKDPRFTNYSMFRNDKLLGGPISSVNQVTFHDNANLEGFHQYFVVMRRSDGIETKSGTLNLQNKCF